MYLKTLFSLNETVLNEISSLFKVVVHTCDVLWCKKLVKTQSYTSLTTSSIISLFNPIELWSIAMHCGG